MSREKMRCTSNVHFAVVVGLAIVMSGLFQAPARAANPEGLVKAYINKQIPRLKPTSVQKPTLKRYLAMTSASRRKIFKDLGVRLGKSITTYQAMQLQARIWALAKTAKARMKKVLTPKQLKVYDAIRNEVKALLQRKLTS